MRMPYNLWGILLKILLLLKTFYSKIKGRMIKCGADIALMTGSGPTVFALCRTEKRADRVVNSMKGFVRKFIKLECYRI